MLHRIKIATLCFVTFGCTSINTDSADTDDQTKMAALQRQIAQLTAEIYLLKEQNIDLMQSDTKNSKANKPENTDGNLPKYPIVFGPEKTFDEAKQEFISKKYSDSIVTLKRHRNFFPNAPEAPDVLLLLIDCYIKTTQWDQALEISRTFEQNFATSKLIGKSKYWQGVALERLGKKSAATTSYLEATALAPNTDTATDATEALKNLRAEK